ncbi:FtsX-like permease family protein [Secundilactobacillus collinoides]|uniref:ABC superfamily ATP binding cassette transporter, permease protein n=2 Tax=Secundilactobacillus collinoides TaxID=33960 RepID=A0A0R2BDI1_SECCO|nr:FtsX-like permease family protein [Secundilactobacillus collinoides]KRM77002.1 ABC superfamily ATP binding cassette transporter, permease protein [Secundilactobacillus collinoides DSM 20515 = JCM 1123]KZL40189.1 hypothetical protein TY91_08685 [Secundilactobacillus collinoides]
MLNKLAFAGIKSRLKDYVVLFSGLVMSSAIFYMFEALATNQSFIKNNTSVSGASFIFQLGAVLLTIITLVYIFYANSFLMSMRRHDYGMFMMLGAKQRKIGQLILLETVVIGVIASVIGILVGWLLTGTLGNFMMSVVIGSRLKHFSAFYLPAVVTTVGLYLGLFLIAGVVNWLSLTKTQVLQLLKGDQQPNRPVLKPVLQVVQVIGGLILLAVGYYCMAHVQTIGLFAILIALVTIVSGTYFLFNAIFIWLVLLLKRTSWATKGLNTFTLSQLQFRIRNYTKMLSVVSILFALALGAITVGIGFHRQIDLMANVNSPYTMAIPDATTVTQKRVDQLKLATKATYQQKETKTTVYYNAAELKTTPLQRVTTTLAELQKQHRSNVTVHYGTMSTTQLQKNPVDLELLQSGAQQTKIAKVVSAAQFARIKGTAHKLLVFRVANLKADQQALKTIQKGENLAAGTVLPGGYGMLVLSTAIYGGLEFMGLFLGIAFLAMLASCLMFKILSGASSDKQRYNMLNKLGTRGGILRRSINREVGVLFTLPGIVGVIHVLFGLQLFKLLMINPYDQIWIPFTIFILLYIIYYVITVRLYERIVLPEIQINN